MAHNWIKKETSFNPSFKFETPNDEFIGTLLAIREGKIKDSNVHFADFATEEGETVSILLPSSLEYQVTHDDIGTLLKIVYTGEVKNPKTGRLYKAFEVYKAAPDELPF